MRISFIASLLLASLGTVTAAEVSREQAVNMAQTKVDGTVDNVRLIDYEGQKAYYIVQFAEGGWVLVSADDTSIPIIGYSPDGVYQTEGQPENMRNFMTLLARQVISNKATGTRAREWDERRSSDGRRRAAGEVIKPLIEVNWNQTGSYQKYCPGTGKNQAVVGCVAVGMAQAMSVAKWPARPVGEFTYVSKNYGQQYINYDNEPAYDWNAIIAGDDKHDGAARLLWHCGVAVSMDYGVDGSGAQSAAISTALKRNFQYPQSVKCYNRSSFDGTDDDWKELLLNEFRDGRAVAYSGSDPKGGYGHCFNLDGYDGEFFHVNWGWGGANNSYFPLNGLKDAKMGYTYTDGQDVVIGIRPPSNKPSNIELSARKVLAGQPAGTYVADVIVESEAKNPRYSYTLTGKYSMTQHDYTEAPFEVNADNQLVTTKPLTAGTRQEVTIEATNILNKGSVKRTFYITVVNDPTGVTEVSAAQPVPQQYYSLSGTPLSKPAKGLTIVRQRMADGTIKTVKRMNQ